MTDPAQRPPSSAPSLGLRALELARRDVGVLAERNVYGPHVQRVMAPCIRNGRRLGLGAGYDWCAGQASWWVWHAWEWADGPLDGDEPNARLWSPDMHTGGGAPPIGYRAAVSELCADAFASRALRMPPTAEIPQPGALLIFGRANQNPLHNGLGHVAICERWSPVDGISLISGNDSGGVRRREWAAGEMSPWGPVLAWIELG